MVGVYGDNIYFIIGQGWMFFIIEFSFEKVVVEK